MKGYFCDRCKEPYMAEKGSPRVEISNRGFTEEKFELCPECYEAVKALLNINPRKPITKRPYPGYEECLKIDPGYPCAHCGAPQDQCLGHFTGCDLEREWCIKHGIKHKGEGEDDT